LKRNETPTVTVVLGNNALTLSGEHRVVIVILWKEDTQKNKDFLKKELAWYCNEKNYSKVVKVDELK
jgi:hypothetical protein